MHHWGDRGDRTQLRPNTQQVSECSTHSYQRVFTALSIQSLQRAARGELTAHETRRTGPVVSSGQERTSQMLLWHELYYMSHIQTDTLQWEKQNNNYWLIIVRIPPSLLHLSKLLCIVKFPNTCKETQQYKIGGGLPLNLSLLTTKAASNKTLNAVKNIFPLLRLLKQQSEGSS